MLVSVYLLLALCIAIKHKINDFLAANQMVNAKRHIKYSTTHLDRFEPWHIWKNEWGCDQWENERGNFRLKMHKMHTNTPCQNVHHNNTHAHTQYICIYTQFKRFPRPYSQLCVIRAMHSDYGRAHSHFYLCIGVRACVRACIYLLICKITTDKYMC